MFNQRTWLSFLALLGFVGVGFSKTCPKDMSQYSECGKEEIKDRSTCLQKTVGEVPCCFNPKDTGGTQCFVNLVEVWRNNVGSRSDAVKARDKFASENAGTYSKPSKQDIEKSIDGLPEGTSPEAKEKLGQSLDPNFKQSAMKRSLSFNLLALGGVTSGLSSSLFPECPVHVKYCYRVPCGGYHPAKETDAKVCLSDPTCCFDYQLAFMRSILTPGFMKDTPTCYYGATSNQWRYITNFFRPWNPWYTDIILSSFEGVFNTSAFSVISGLSQRLACSIESGRKAYPVGSKSELECNLVSGCWDDSLPSGSQCLMASSFAQNLFSNFLPGSERQVYPSLYTNDHSDTQCSSNWFDFGPKAYRRLPCGIGPAPPSLMNKLKWCPIQDCCLNYASIGPEDAFLLQALTGGGAGGFSNLFGSSFSQMPGLSGLSLGSTPNTLLAYLISGSSSTSSLSDLFCPYRNYFAGSSLFPDLSEFTDGCCDIPACYHKKILQGGGPRRPIPPIPPLPSPYQWSQWSQCSNPCGFGSRTRQCVQNGRPYAPANCGGGRSSEQCTGSQCVQPAAWSQWSDCSNPCGPGTRTRQCLQNNVPVSQFNCGGGQTSEQCFGNQCGPPAMWGQWSDCSNPCGPGTRTRRCMQNNAEVSSFNCGRGQASEQCTGTNCGPTYRWGGQYSPVAPCSTTCGPGMQDFGPSCVDLQGQVVPSNFCPPPQPIQKRPCNEGPCRCQPGSGNWGQWQPEGSCSVTCGGGRQVWTRPCMGSEGPVEDSCCHGGEISGSAEARCSTNPCGPPPPNYRWSGQWVPDGPCSSTCGPGSQLFVQQCVNSQGQVVSDQLCPPPQPTDTRQCTVEACETFGGQWGQWQDVTSCGTTCGPTNLQRQRRVCRSFDGSTLPSNRCVGNDMRVVECPSAPCEYHWTGWTTDDGCKYNQNTGRCTKTRTRYCYQRSGTQWSMAQPQSLCVGDNTREETCPFQDCFSNQG